MRQLSEPAPPPRPRARREGPAELRRTEAARAVVGYGEQDAWRVRLSIELVVAESAAIARAVERRLEGEPGVSFALPAGAGGPATHAEALIGWIAGMDEPLSAASAERFREIARAHTSRGGSAEVRVPARYIALAFGVLQDEIASTLTRAMDDGEERAATIAAWNKLLMTQLDAFLSVYNGLEGRPHWY